VMGGKRHDGGWAEKGWLNRVGLKQGQGNVEK
jgi:hypothetical protein